MEEYEKHEESVGEFLTQIIRRALKGESDFCSIKEQHARAIINGSGASTIQNAIIVVTTKNSCKEWEVKEGEVKKCPEPICIGIKNMNVIAGCIGDDDKEESFFRIKKKRNTQSEILSICAAVEVDECAIAFYFNSETNESCYIVEESCEKESTDLFIIAKYLRDLEVMHDEEQDMQCNRLEKVEAATTFSWF